MVWQLSSFGERVYGGGEEVPRRKRESRGIQASAKLPVSLLSIPWVLTALDKTVLSLPGHQVSAQGRDRAKQ